MLLTLYTPSRGSIIPPDADPDGDLWAERAATHPALLLVPLTVESLPGLRPGIAGPYHAPPKAVLDAMYAASFRINAAVSGSGVTVTLVDEIMPCAQTSWRAVIQDGNSGSGVYGEGSENLTSVSVTWSTLNLYFSWSDGLWWPGLSILLQTTDLEADGDGITSAVIGGSGTIDGDPCGVSLTFCGEMIPLYYTGSVEGAITGTITIEVDEYLTVE